MGTKMTVQDLIFELIKKSPIPNSKSLVRSLKKNRHLWKAILIDRDVAPLLLLRDLERDIFNTTLIHILPFKGREDELFSWAQTWNPDELEWIDSFYKPSASEINDKFILELWWD
jgi:hypothetical protein